MKSLGSMLKQARMRLRKPPTLRKIFVLVKVCSAGEMRPVPTAHCQTASPVSERKASTTFIMGPAAATSTRPSRSLR